MAVATVVAAVDQARGRTQPPGPEEPASKEKHVSTATHTSTASAPVLLLPTGEQVEKKQCHLLTSICYPMTPHAPPTCSSSQTIVEE